MPIPLIVGAAAVALAGTGIKKGLDAKEKNEEAREIVNDAIEELEDTKERVESEKDDLEYELKELGKLKLQVFNNQMRRIVELAKKCKDASSELKIGKYISQQEFKEISTSVDNSLEISKGLADGVASGALIAMGSYGAVGSLATASTGTAISSLSGAAATNATLAWLGGGSLAAGGGGMALGTAVLGGAIAGPAIAVAGFVMDSKAEANLSEAYEKRREIQVEVKKLEGVIQDMQIAEGYVQELAENINEMVERFEQIYKSLQPKCWKRKLNTLLRKEHICQKEEFNQLIIIASNLKGLLDISIFDSDGSNNLFFEDEIKKVIYA